MIDLVFIMGHPRSGTAALFRSLVADRTYLRLDAANPKAFVNFRLRPELEIRPHLTQRAVLRALNNPPKATLEEFACYNTKILWLYRNPVNVYYSWAKLNAWVRLAPFLSKWCSMNRKALETKDQIITIKYEDLVQDPSIHAQLCTMLRAKGQNIFYPDSHGGEVNLDESTKIQIRNETELIMRQLDETRLK